MNDYKNTKRYLLENTYSMEQIIELFPNIKTDIIVHEDEFIIFTDGYLFPVKLHDELEKWEYDSDRFAELVDGNFVKINGIDVSLAIDFIESQAYESEVAE